MSGRPLLLGATTCAGAFAGLSLLALGVFGYGAHSATLVIHELHQEVNTLELEIAALQREAALRAALEAELADLQEGRIRRR
jgi:hypothetical protein